MAIFGDIEIELAGYALDLKYSYFHQEDDFTLLRGSYRTDTGEELPLIYLDLVTQCHRQSIMQAIHSDLKIRAA